MDMSESKEVTKVNKFLSKMLQKNLDKKNKCIFNEGNALVAVVAVPSEDLLMVSSPVINLPEENLLPLFRRLLNLNLSETKDAAFAINEAAGTIDLQIKRPLSNLEYNEFKRAVSTVADLADQYNDLVAQTFDAEVVSAYKVKSGSWSSYINALNPVNAIFRKRDLKGRNQKIRTAFNFIGLIASFATGIYVYNIFGSWALAIFTLLWVSFIVTRAIPDLITDSDKILRFFYFATYPAIGVALLYFTYQWWGKWWLSALIGYILGIFLGRLITTIIMPRIALEEARDDEERVSTLFKT
jgi:hypothetical protein